MKKIYKFYFNEQSYILKENEEDRFVIPRDTLEFNGNEFYQNLFKEYSFEDKIEIENMMNEKEIEKYQCHHCMHGDYRSRDSHSHNHRPVNP